jgi:hypothetical protein
VHKEYRALLAGSLDQANASWPQEADGSIVIRLPVGGKLSETRLRVLETTADNVYGSITRVALFPQSGRRHQLRQHCAAIGNSNYSPLSTLTLTLTLTLILTLTLTLTKGCPILGDDLYHAAAFCPDLPTRLQLIAQAGGGAKGDDDDELSLDPAPSGPEAALDTTAEGAEEEEGEQGGEELEEEGGEEGEGATPQPEARYPVPMLRKGAGLFLMARAVEFDHPYLFAAAPSPADTGVETPNAPSSSSSSSSSSPSPSLSSPSPSYSPAPPPSALRVRVQVAECRKFGAAFDKAGKGASWLASNKVHIHKQREGESAEGSADAKERGGSRVE